MGRRWKARWRRMTPGGVQLRRLQPGGCGGTRAASGISGKRAGGAESGAGVPPGWTRAWCTSRPTTCLTASRTIPMPRDDHPHPLGAYAVSKLAGELYAQAYLDSAADRAHLGRVRAWRPEDGARQFRGADAAAGASSQPIRVVEDHVASPTYAPLLAARTIDLVERDQSGVFHVGGGSAHLLVSLRAVDFRGSGCLASRWCWPDQRARVPHGGAAAQVFGAIQCQDGTAGPGADAAAGGSLTAILRGAREAVQLRSGLMA